MGRAVWLLDVDGVINVARPGWGADPGAGTVHTGGLPCDLRWAPGLIARIRAVQATGSVDIRWCSTWCDDADQLERLFGLPRLGRAWSNAIDGTYAGIAKLAAARAVIDAGDRLIWTDDGVVPTSGQVHDELVSTGRALLIAPLPDRGLQPEHLDAIEAFIAAGVDDETRSSG
jgi:hypothetical protein